MLNFSLHPFLCLLIKSSDHVGSVRKIKMVQDLSSQCGSGLCWSPQMEEDFDVISCFHFLLWFDARPRPPNTPRSALFSRCDFGADQHHHDGGRGRSGVVSGSVLEGRRGFTNTPLRPLGFAHICRTSTDC